MAMIRLDDQIVPAVPEGSEILASLATLLEKRWANYRKTRKRCRQAPSEKNLHAFRVEVRRTLSVLGLVTAVLPDRQRRIQLVSDRLTGELKASSRVRDTHVQLLNLERMAQRHPGAKPLRVFLQRREPRRIKGFTKQLRQWRCGKTSRQVRRLHGALENPVSGGRAGQAGADLAHAIDAAFRKLKTLDHRVDARHTATIHALRVAFKKFRYMVEAFSAIAPGVSSKQIEAMRGYQKRMGEIQDAGLLLRRMEKFMRRHPSAAPGMRSFRGWLQARRDRLVESFLQSPHSLYNFWPPHPTLAGVAALNYSEHGNLPAPPRHRG